MRRRALIAVAALPLVLAGCTATSAQPTASAWPRAAVEILQGRTDYSRGIFTIAVTDVSAEPVTIATATYRSPRFADAATYTASPSPVTLAVGDTINLRVPIPALDCAGADEPGTVTIAYGDGRTETVVPTDENDTVDRLSNEGCLAEDVAAIVSITPPDRLRVDGSGADAVAHIDLAFAPTGADGDVKVAQVRSTTLITPADGSPVWSIDSTESAASAARTVTLDVRPTRCDAHALADDKVGTILVIDVAVSTGRSGRYLLPLPPSAKAQVYSYITTVCGD